MVAHESDADASGTLHIVSTPIGNLGDLSPRAVEIMNGVAAILAEDTRHTKFLCGHFGIQTPLIAYHEHNEARSAPKIVSRLLAGESFALVSDAGTPLLSDPGERLVREAIDAGVKVSPVPGASALLAALVGSGLGSERFTFYGFRPRKGRERSRWVADVVDSKHTSVLYEAPGRVGETLSDLADAGAAERKCVVARELTKQFEEFRRGTVGELAAYYSEAPPRGEVVIVVSGGDVQQVDESVLRERAAEMRAQGMTPRDIMSELTANFGASRNLAYKIAHE